MKSVLPEWYGHDDETLKQIVTTGTIAFDANVMLDLYRVGRNQREQLIAVLEAVRERIFVPYQVALEFHRNRLDTAGTNVTVYADLLSSIDVVLEEKYLNKIRGGLQAEVRQIVEAAREDLAGKLTEWRDEHVIPFEDVREGDPVLKALDELLDDQVFGKCPSPEELEGLKSTAHERYKDLIPPGYLDKGKDDPTGDYLIWVELLEHAKTSKRPLLFVTGDQKDDWYRRPVRGQRLGPRVELVAEMRSVAKNDLYHQVPLDLFLDLAIAYLNASVEKETIETVRSIVRPTPVFDRETLAKMYPDVPYSDEFRDTMQRALESYGLKGAGYPDLAEAMAQGNWGIAGSLTLRPEFQSRIFDQIRGPNFAEFYKIPNIAELYKIPNSAGLFTEFYKQIQEAPAEFYKRIQEAPADLYKQAQEAPGLMPRSPSEQTTQQKNPGRKAAKTSAGKKAEPPKQPKPSRVKKEE
ncbi:PIN domain-containing protein [Mycobacterium sp.]|uniref:PIN domain-containing protein n=1 Tax=Mycobacterium sp. TaxID=1785 RepID=UPI003F9C3A96